MDLVTFSQNEKLIRKKNFHKLKKNNTKFVGEWCLKPENLFEFKDKRNFYKSYDWKKSKNIKKDINYLKSLNKKILINLSNSLNQYHNKNLDKRFWDILVHRWLWEYITQVYSRWQIIQTIFKKNRIKSSYILDLNDKDFIPNNSLHFNRIVFSTNNYWGQWTFANILKYNNKKKIKVFAVEKNQNLKNEILSLDIKSGYYNFKYFFLGRRKIFFYRFFIPLKIKLKLILNNLIIAFRISKEKKIIILKNENKRDGFYKYNKEKDKFLNFLNYFLIYNFPKIYLENFESLENQYTKVNWPKKPDYIVTTHGHYYDEVFKYYTARKQKKGSKFLVAQHGSGGFYFDDNYFNVYHDNRISDRYLTWGWNKNKKTYPLFLTTVQGKREKEFSFSPKKKILLILYELNSVSWYPPAGYCSEFEKKKMYFNLIYKFTKNLKIKFQKKTYAKLLSMTGLGLIESSIKKNLPNIKFVASKKNAHKLRSDYNIQIEAFLSTGFFESMYLNNPVILLNDERISGRYSKKFRKYIKLLKESNICFDNAEKAANFMNENYDKLDVWWNSKKIQKTRELFCKEHCKHSSNIIRDFNNSLKFK